MAESAQHQPLQQQTGPAITGPAPVSAAPPKPGNTTWSSSDGSEKHAASVTISPATSNQNLRFDHPFERVFMPTSLRRAFRGHDAFGAVFEERQGGFDEGWGGGGSRGPNKFPGKIVALSDNLTVGKSADTATGAPADGEFSLTDASRGLVSTIMTAYNRCEILQLDWDGLGSGLVCH